MARSASRYELFTYYAQGYMGVRFDKSYHINGCNYTREELNELVETIVQQRVASVPLEDLLQMAMEETTLLTGGIPLKVRDVLEVNPFNAEWVIRKRLEENLRESLREYVEWSIYMGHITIKERRVA